MLQVTPKQFFINIIRINPTTNNKRKHSDQEVSFRVLTCIKRGGTQE
jgi:hypothetical protein